MPEQERTILSTLFAQVLQLLEAYDILDKTFHIKGCGYTDTNPNCDCAKFGRKLWETLQSVTSQPESP